MRMNIKLKLLKFGKKNYVCGSTLLDTFVKLPLDIPSRNSKIHFVVPESRLKDKQYENQQSEKKKKKNFYVKSIDHILTSM